MERIQLTKNIYLDEVVPKSTYQKWGKRSMMFVPLTMVRVNQELRDYFGPVTINNWWDEGPRQFSGYRPPDCDTGAKESAHRRALATDSKYKNATADEVRAHIMANEAKYLEMGLRRLESAEYAPTWLHADCSPLSWEVDKSIKPFIQIIEP